MNRVTRTDQEFADGAFSLVKTEPTRGLEPRTYRLQDAPSVLTMAATSDFTVYSDRSGGHNGSGGRQFASHMVSRRPHQRCDLQIDPLGHQQHARATQATSTTSRCDPPMQSGGPMPDSRLILSVRGRGL